MKLVKKILLALLLVFIIAQFFGPEKNEGDYASLDAFIAETNPPEDVKTILKSTCFDCHSNTTVYPWYNNITPVNYWLADHIKEGKSELNFSNWKKYSLKRKEHKFEEIWEEVEKKEMPLESYTYTHSEANLTDAQIASVVTWAKQIQANYKAEINKK
jgi:uncharacterized protein YxeA